MMDLQEAYKTMQAASGIEVGDTVKMLRMPLSDDEMGWQVKTGSIAEGSSEDYRTHKRALGEECTVREIDPIRGIGINYPDNGWDYAPFFCLELISKGKPPIKIGEHTVEFTDNGLRVGCQEVSYKTLDEINERRKK